MKHHWIIEHPREIFLTDFEATELISFGTTRVAINVEPSDWVLCDVCGTILRVDTINNECPERD